MQINQLSERLSVSAQILPEDVAELKSMGYQSIICNRPDGEAPDQPAYAQIEAAARAAQIEMRFVPIHSSGITEADETAFANAINTLPPPVLAYCRSGTRSAYVALQSGSL